MPLTLGVNLASLTVQRRLAESSTQAGISSARLASGARINRPSDDAAGQAVQLSLSVNARVFGQGIRNISDGQSLLSIAEGGLQQLSGITIRMRELATQAASGTFSTVQRRSLQTESDELIKEFNRIIESTSFNGLRLLDRTLTELRIQGGYGIDGGISTGLTQALSGLRGNGSYTIATSSPVMPGGVETHAVGDMNGDGIADLVYSTSIGTAISLRLGNGNGTFAAATTIGNTAYAGGSVQLADLNGDGRLDVVAQAVQSGPPNNTATTTILNNGSGSFSTSTSVNVGQFFRATVGDVNGDGRADVLLSGPAGGLLRLGSASGLSTTTTSLNLGGAPFATVLIGDADGDGRADILVGDDDVVTTSILRGNGNGTFATLQLLAGDFAVQRGGDLNRDGTFDLIGVSGVGPYEVRKVNSNLTTSVMSAVDTSSSAVNDFDGDGYLDILTLAGTLHRGNGDGSFKSAISWGIGTQTGAYGDFNGDGILDAITLSGGLTVRLQNTSQDTRIQGFSLISASDALRALSVIDSTLTRITNELGSIGAAQSRLESGLRALVAERENATQAASRIGDVDVASESANLTRTLILQSIGSALLGQANQSPQIALSLLTGA